MIETIPFCVRLGDFCAPNIYQFIYNGNKYSSKNIFFFLFYFVEAELNSQSVGALLVMNQNILCKCTIWNDDELMPKHAQNISFTNAVSFSIYLFFVDGCISVLLSAGKWRPFFYAQWHPNHTQLSDGIESWHKTIVFRIGLDSRFKANLEARCKCLNSDFPSSLASLEQGPLNLNLNRF